MMINLFRRYFIPQAQMGLSRLAAPVLFGMTLAQQGYASPVVNISELSVDENSADGTVVGQVSASGGAYTQVLQLDVGSKSFNNWRVGGSNYEGIDFNTPFAQPPIVFTQVQSDGLYAISYATDATAKTTYATSVIARTRQQTATTDGVEVILESDVNSITHTTGSEKVGWLAVSEAASGYWSGSLFQTRGIGRVNSSSFRALIFNSPFDTLPVLNTSVSTSNQLGSVGLEYGALLDSKFSMRIDREDNNTHDYEAVSVLAIDDSGQPLKTTDGKIIGEVGSVPFSDTDLSNAITVNLNNTFNNPIVFVDAAGYLIDDAEFRFTNISNNSFTLYLHNDDESTSPTRNGDFDLHYQVFEAGTWSVGVENYTYSISAGNDSGAFAIDPATGVITVADSSLLDFENGAQSFALSITVTDGQGQTGTSQVVVAVNDVQDSFISEATTLSGNTANTALGWSLTDAGDINGDGYADFVVGAPLENHTTQKAGRAYVILGNAAGALPTQADLLAGRGGFAIYGASENDQAGFAVTGGDDVNGDGLDDLVIGAPFSSANGESSGAAYVVFGKTDTDAIELSELHAGSSTKGFMVVGAHAYDRVGGSALLGDINGDGLADVVVGEPNRPDNSGTYSAGSGSVADDSALAYVVFGARDSGTVSLSDLASTQKGFVVQEPGRTVNGLNAYGTSVMPIGDYNSDGLIDFLVMREFLTSDAENIGAIIYGRITSDAIDLSASASNDADVTVINAEAGNYGLWDGSDGSGANPRPHFQTAPLGDVNGDGRSDFALLLTKANCCSAISYPRAYVVLGKTSQSTIELSSIANGTGGYVIDNDASEVTLDDNTLAFGAVAGIGDINGDGFDDFAIGDPAAGGGNGRVYVVYGSSSTGAFYLSTLSESGRGFSNNGAAGDSLGHMIASIGDFNGDGIDDAAFGIADADHNNVANSGALYLLRGAGDSITEWGTAQADLLNGSSNVNDHIAAGLGNDFIAEIAANDSVFAGGGDDVIEITSANFRRIDGGFGTDTLKFSGENIALNLARNPERVRSVEIFDINGSGANSLWLNKTVTQNNFILVKGGTDDQLIALNQLWRPTETSEIYDGVAFDVYVTGDSQIWVQQGIDFTYNASPSIENQSFNVEEYTEGGEVFGAVAAAANDLGDTVTYAIIAGNEKGYFAVNAETGELSVSDKVNRLDYESGASYQLTLQVTDSYNDITQASVDVNVLDISVISHNLSMDASGGGSIWAGNESIMTVIGQQNDFVGDRTYDLSIPKMEASLMQLHMKGYLDMKSEISFTGGSVEANLPVDVSLSFPDEVQPGSAIEIAANVAFKDNANFSVSSPQFRAWAEMTLREYEFGVGTSLPKTITEPPPTLNSYISGDAISASTSIESLASTVDGSRDSQNPLMMHATIALPDWVNRQVSYAPTWTDFAIDLDGEIEGCKQDAFGSVGEDLSYRADFSFITSYLWARADLYQQFTLELQPSAVMVLEDGTQIDFDPTKNLQFTPELIHDKNGDGVIDATLEVALNPIFTNDTSLFASVAVPFQTAQMSYNFQEAICNGSSVILYGKDGLLYDSHSEGPLIDEEFRFNLGGVDDNDLINKTFARSLSTITYTEKLSFDLCDGQGTACAAPLNSAPVVSDVAIEGFARVGQTLQGTYLFTDGDGDLESGSTYQWQTADDESGNNSAVKSEAQDYLLEFSDGGKYIRYCVLPSDGDAMGSQACSAWVWVERELDITIPAGFGKALDLNGTNQYARIYLRQSFDPRRTSFTVETWLYIDALSNGIQAIIQQMNRSGTGRTILGLVPDGRLYSFLGGAATFTPAMTIGEWHHVAITYNHETSELIIYVDGQQQALEIRYMEFTYGDVLLGVNKGLNGNYFNGALDETRIWTVARTEEQIQNTMNVAVSSDDDDLLSYFTYDTAPSTKVTSKNGAYSAYLYGAPNYRYSREQSMWFDGWNNFAQIPNHADLEFGAGSFTLEAWVNAAERSTGDYRNVITKKRGGGTQAGWGLRLNWTTEGFKPQLLLADGVKSFGIQGADEIARDTWVHMAATIDREAQIATLYIDGKSVGSISIADMGSVSNGQVVRLGAWSHWAKDDNWIGDLDEIRIWDVARTASEISGSLHDRFGELTPGLTAYYTFEQGNVKDDSGFGHNAWTRGNIKPSERGLSVKAPGYTGYLPAFKGANIRVATQPTYGNVVVDASTGEFIYTPTASMPVGGDIFSYYLLNDSGDYSMSEEITVNPQ